MNRSHDFIFPAVNLRNAWSLWWQGHQAKKHSPYRTLRSHDFVTAQIRKKFYEWRFVFTYMELLLQEKRSNWYTSLTQTASSDLIQQSFDLLNDNHLPQPAVIKRRRKPGELLVLTVAKDWHHAKVGSVKSYDKT